MQHGASVALFAAGRLIFAARACEQPGRGGSEKQSRAAMWMDNCARGWIKWARDRFVTHIVEVVVIKELASRLARRHVWT
jgi:hypothetical protein